MAKITRLTKINMERESKHSEVEATYSVVMESGERYLQLDTYGSSDRAFPGKKSQSLRMTREVLEELLRAITKKE